MNEDNTALTEREEIEMLLPWYVGGNLDATDHDRVERYLAQHPEVRRQLELIREEQHQTILANEALPTPSAGALERLMASLPGRRPGLLARLRASEGYRNIAALFGPSAPRAIRYAAYAAVGLLLVQSLAITALLVKDNGAGYQTAAGKDGGEGLFFLVAFTDTASTADLTRLLQDFDARIIDGPKPGGIFQVKVRVSDPSPAAAEALQRRLAARRDVVRLALPAKE
ncbi:MAG TPA: hypothetical protein VFR19_15770 [Hyphomicrobiaceae bacterium]|jgi:hypothetical protein|nr:hypothetical protein [Hyphomicrobiaceae bacterium]